MKLFTAIFLTVSPAHDTLWQYGVVVFCVPKKGRQLQGYLERFICLLLLEFYEDLIRYNCHKFYKAFNAYKAFTLSLSDFQSFYFCIKSFTAL